ncbi:MAG: hypothetical protein ACR2MG_13805 [Pyrinomonadaceae bacterium]
MMTLTITLKPEIEAVLAQKAMANGCAVIDYVENLIEKDVDRMKTLDEIFAPFRTHTEQISEEEIDDLVKKARREVFAEKKDK